MPTPFLTAHWRHLVMINWEIPPAILLRRVPKGTTLDSFGGRTYVSVVGFMFERARVRGLPVPCHINFEEINLRFYVRRESGGEVRRGVCFIREIVPRRAIASLARRLYNEPYVALPMRHTIARGENLAVRYAWRFQKNWQSLAVTTRGEAIENVPGSVEEFIAEHYWGYTGQRDGGTLEYQVEHPRWRVWQTAENFFECDVAKFYGEEFAPVLAAKPVSAFLAEGSPVKVYAGRRIA